MSSIVTPLSNSGISYAPVERERSAEGRRRQIADLWHARLKASEQDSWRYRRMLPAYYDAYRAVSQGRYHSYNNNVNTNSLFAMVESDVARKFRAIYSSPAVSFEGTSNPGSSLIARKQQALYYQQVREDKGLLKAYRYLKSASLYGVAVKELGWKYLTRKGVDFQVQRSPLDGKIYRTGTPKLFTDFDGPSSLQHDLLDFFPQPGRAFPWEWDWAITRSWQELDQVEALIMSGQLTGRSEFERLKREGGMTSDLASDVRQLRGIQMLAGGGEPADPYGRPVMLTTCYGWIPQELAPDGIAFRKTVIANNKYILLDEPFPWAHGRLDYVFQTYSPFADPHYFFAPGKVEIGFSLAMAANKILSGVLDGVDLTLHPWMLMNEDALVDPRNLGLRAGRVVTIRGNPAEMVMPGKFDMNGMAFGLQAMGILDRGVQKGSGIIEDVVSGEATGGRETARGVLTRAEGASNRLDAEVMIYEEMAAVPEADAMMELNRQMMTEELEAQLLGASAVTDPVTGRSIQPGENLTISPMDVNARFKARAVGASQRLGKAMQIQNAQGLMQAVFNAASAGGPAMLGRLNLMGWVRWLALKMEEGPAVNDLLYEDPQQAAASVAALMEGNGAAAESGDPSLVGSMPAGGSAEAMMTEGDLQGLVGTMGGGVQQ